MLLRRLLLAVFCFTLIMGRAMAIEEPAFTLVVQDGPFSVRDVAPIIVAEVVVPGDQAQAVGRGFRLLAGYIFGGNQGGRKIAMTAPVAQLPAGPPGQWVVRFTMPRGQTLAGLPAPNDPRIGLRSLPAARMAVLRFAGWAGPADFAAKGTDLARRAAAHHLRLTGPTIFAQYNPPWTLWFMRRNEVMAEVAR